ncbi:MAG: hypothetical protein ACLROS_07465 [Faecalibacterium sp.]
MTRRDVRLRTSWFGYRKLDVINCIEHLCALSDAEERLARETQQGLEADMAQTQQENRALRQELARKAAAQTVTAAQADSMRQQMEKLVRRLAAAKAQIRRYQTRLFAYERSMIALRKENAELEAKYNQAQQLCQQQVQQSTPPPQETAAQAPAKPKPKPVQKTPPKPVVKAVPKAEPWVPRTELERLSVELMDQMTRLMTG